MSKYNNLLKNESSPYLLQHAENPVDWHPWNDAVLQQAKKENKLLLISIGYSACHWCHVMAHESFEDEATAKLMNEHFVNIKIDREERPDVDQIYMNALQLMTGRGGWPLNIIALPDARPIWGGTYLPKRQWNGVLQQLADLYKTDPEKMREYAEKLTHGIQEMEALVKKETTGLNAQVLEKSLLKWKTRFDKKMGGTQQVPKFMMPNNYRFLLRYAFQTKDQNLKKFIFNTLGKISFGGVFDHLGGGFSRYSTDAKWHVPHFEKMLYDNAQLVSLYSDAFLATQNPWYKNVVFKTLDFVKRELTAENGAFYSALDADSKNENGELKEGAYYVWNKTELKSILKENFDVFAEYYNVNDYGFWEDNNYVLIRKETNSVIAEKFSLSIKELEQTISICEKKLFKKRALRNRPGLDDKSLTSWNAMMAKAFLDAYRVFQNEDYLKTALKNAQWIIDCQIKPDGSLFHNYKNGKSTINAYLDDYAFTIEAFISLYENTFDENWLHRADQLTNVVFENFFNPEKSFFFYTSKKDKSLISRTFEYQDNVIPSSNSTMAKNLFLLSHYFENKFYRETSEQMLKNIQPQIENYPEAYSNWLDLLLNFAHNFYEIVFVGKKALEKSSELNHFYLPQKLIAGSFEKSKMPLLKNRFKKGETWIYSCLENACKTPTKNIDEILKQLI
ncbi:MAG TPA: thioredoxin domain-containing protein [Flavobacteriaceae bacterium]|nr:thioredoxin domain-containing protein [Flavobacteriaceae bacterium]